MTTPNPFDRKPDFFCGDTIRATRRPQVFEGVVERRDLQEAYVVPEGAHRNAGYRIHLDECDIEVMPKPEPGLGAVIETERGRVWVHVEQGWWSEPGNDGTYAWTSLVHLGLDPRRFFVLRQGAPA